MYVLTYALTRSAVIKPSMAAWVGGTERRTREGARLVARELVVIYGAHTEKTL